MLCWRKQGKLFRLWLATLALLLGALGGAATSSAETPPPGVRPAAVDLALKPGDSAQVVKEVQTRPLPPKLDLFFLADTTGSMGPAIDNVKANSSTIVDAIEAATADHRYAAGQYKDFPAGFGCGGGFSLGANFLATDDHGAAAKAAINTWSAGGGCDGPEAQFHALHRIATPEGGILWRADATKVLVWFGDAPGHDSVCPAISGDPHLITEASVTAELVAAKIKVLAVSTTTGFPGGLDGDPKLGSFDYVPFCGPPGGLPGQAGRIAPATGGLHLVNVQPDRVSDEIARGLTALPTTVAPVATCPTGISVAFDAPSQTVPSGTKATFTETISVAGGTPSGTYTCTVRFLVDGAPGGPEFDQRISVLVYAYPTGGAFVLGDKTVTSATPSTTVTWWGAQWSKKNDLSGGGAPAAFKGYVDTFSPAPPCGGTWTTDPGNSPPPPAASTIPSYMAVLVASDADKAGSTIAGNIVQIVIVKTDPGYAPDPGHEGTGKVVRVLCQAQ